MSAQLQDFFRTCDRDGSRSIDAEAFRDLCSRLSIPPHDADLIFDDLDVDRDGRISFADFSKGFSNFLSASSNEDVVAPRHDDPEEEAARNNVWSTLTTEAERVGGGKTSSDGKLKWLLNELQTSEHRHLVPLLEGAVEELVSSLRQLQEEKARLEESWRREKVEHQRHLKRMEEELDSQVKEVECRMRMKAQEEVEDERKSLQSKMDTELHKLAAIEKVFAWFRTQCPVEPVGDTRLDEVRSKLNEAVYDNHQLRMSLLDTQTSIALMRSELIQLRTLYEEKCRELSSEKEKILEVLQEQDHLSRQLNLLHDANRRLLDSHDALKNSMECSVRQALTSGGGGLARAKSGSIIGDYLDLNFSRDCLNRCPEEEDLEEDLQEEEETRWQQRPRDQTKGVVMRRKSSTAKEDAHAGLHHSDSGVSVRDSFGTSDFPPSGECHDSDECDDARRRGSVLSRHSSSPEHPKKKHQPVPPSSRQSRLQPSTSEDSLLDARALPRRKISDIKKQLGIEDEPVNWRRSWAPRQSSTPKAAPPTPLPRLSKKPLPKDERGTTGDESALTSVDMDDRDFEPDGPPDHTFKVIFVGDAGVGKSSFALRVSKGVFVRHMSSTLGLDFLMRTLRVDGRNVAVQLWDTAGQERFRSITKSYFRKADGVVLMYDCTCEQSFLNVRQWVEDIDVVCFYNMMAEKAAPAGRASFRRIPLMIVANKVDLRQMALKSGESCISTEQGEKLAKDCDATFMEASAKEGSNVLPAMANLIRSMSTQQELQLSASTMQLCEGKTKKSGGCCSK